MLTEYLQELSERTQESVKEIETLLKNFYKENPETNDYLYTIYIPYPTDTPVSEYNRVSPYANIPLEEWPKTKGNKYLQHLLSLDLQTVPAVGIKDAKVLSLFISDIYENEAFEPLIDETFVKLIKTPAQESIIPPGVMDWTKINEEEDFYTPTEAFYFNLLELKIPATVMEHAWSLEEKDSVASQIHKKIFNLPAYIGGEPIWLQGEDHTGDFVMQFQEAFLPVNMGDSGELYVFTDTAFWQCY